MQTYVILRRSAWETAEDLEEAAGRGDIRDGDHETRAWSLIGISVFLGLKYGIWDKDRSADDIAREAANLITSGIGR